LNLQIEATAFLSGWIQMKYYLPSSNRLTASGAAIIISSLLPADPYWPISALPSEQPYGNP
jgi:hypothetical protein